MSFNITVNSTIQKVIEQKGPFSVIEFEKDPSVGSNDAQQEYFMGIMNVRRRQIKCSLNGQNAIIVQNGAMCWTVGNVESRTGVKGVGDFIGKTLFGSVTGEKAVKPEYFGNGLLVLEPTYNHLIIENTADWGSGMVIEDGMFVACESSVGQSLVARGNASSALAGGEGIFNMCLSGNGFTVLESRVPRSEIIEINLVNDVLKVDGSYAIAWSSSLDFRVARSSKTLLGSAVNGEGLVNVYSGTGKVWMCPTL